MAAADFDGDGDVDLVTANGSENTISVFLNGGRGTFFPAREQALRVGPRSIALADFNRDGRPDLAVADPAGDAVSILINRGEGLFFPDFPVSVPGGPTSAVAGDFNLDGANDFVVAAPGRSAVALVYGNGDGTFQPPVFSVFPEPPVALSMADLDGDRYPDLVVGFRTAVTSLLNDGSGRLAGGSVFGTISGISAVAAADYDGDGRPDAVALSSEAGAVVLYRNALPVSIKRPAPPRSLRAADTPADLGGRVTLTWQQPRADEETGRVVAYDIFRSGARDGAYARIASVGVSAPFLSRDSTLITRVTVDSTATVGVPLFYYMTAKDAFGAASVPSAVVTATSVAQPVFNFDFSNTGLYSVGDTVTVRVSLNPLGYRLRGLSLFLDYHPRALSLLDADAGRPGVQPFALNSALPPGDVLENRLAGEGKINLSVGSLTSDQGLALEIGVLQFVALRDTVAALGISGDAAGNRRTALIDASDGSALSPNLPPQPASVVIRNYRVNGAIRFQGRSANLDLSAQVDLRQPNGLPLSAPYAPANDQDKNRDGVQLTLDRGGGFSLIQVPAGRYAVFAKAFHYLRGRVTGDSVTVGPGSPAAPLAFRWVSAGGAAYTELRGGDANNDNNVNLTDFGLLARHFGAFNVADSQNPAWVADFNGDGRVNLDDFSLLSSNFGEQGFGQGISAKPAPPAARLNVVRSSDGDEEAFRIFVEGVPHRMGNPLQVSGFSADLVYSAEGGAATWSDFLSDALLTEGEAARAQGVHLWWIVRPLGRGLRIAGYVKGGPIQAEGAAEVALLRVGRRRGLPAVQNVWVADGDGVTLPALAEAVDAPPRRPALFQNVPNPFNPATEIAYDVPEEEGAGARVTLRIYNLTGQVVRRLLDAPHAPGRYRVTWDGRDDLGRPVASGVYFYEMEVGAFRDAKRMLLLR
ncbi:VCBS repeat-containing protein [bacterium]|nr:VCBS repeat-containing protein [bacterium]